MPERINGGQALAALGAIVLLVGLFLDWFGQRNAWTTFEVLDLVLAAIAVATLVGLVPASAWGRRSTPVVPPEYLGPLGIAAVVIVIAALINHPPTGAGHSPHIGVWVALAGGLLIALGGILRSARISLVITTRPTADSRGATERPPTSRPPAGPGPAERAPELTEPAPAIEDETATEPITRRRRR